MSKPNTSSRRSAPRKPIVAVEPESSVHTTKAPGAPCKVCGGEIVQESNLVETASTVKMQYAGLHCGDCGVVYKFMPKRRA